MDELVSIIIPMYNCEKTISKTLFSIINQTYKKIEIICVDDGSTDETKKIICEFMNNHENIFYFYKNNGGISSARNYGIIHSKGKYISFIDADDMVSDCFIKTLVDLICENQVNISFVEYCYSNKFRNFQYNGKSKVLNYQEFMEGFFVKNNSFLVTRYMYLAKNIKFDESMIFAEDQKFIYELCHNEKIAYSSSKLYCYYINPNSHTSGVVKSGYLTEENFRKKTFLSYQNTKFEKDALTYLHRFYLGMLLKAFVYGISKEEQFDDISRYSKELQEISLVGIALFKTSVIKKMFLLYNKMFHRGVLKKVRRIV